MISLASIEHEFGHIEVYREKRTGGLVYLQGGCFQTKTDSKGISLVTYIHALFGLILQRPVQTVLVIGCGGGSLAAMLAIAGKRVTVVDVNPAALDIAREYFSLPSKIESHIADGAAFLKSTQSAFDVIVMDAYCGDQIPTHMRSIEFFQVAKSRLSSPRGLFLANVHVIDDADSAAIAYAQAAGQVWRRVRILDAPGTMFRNAIVASGDVMELRPPTLTISPENDAKAVAEDLGRMRF